MRSLLLFQHDTTVAALLSALGVFDDKAPQYAATVLIDLYRDNTKPAQYEVKVYYKNETYGNVSHHLELPGECRLVGALDWFA